MASLKTFPHLSSLTIHHKTVSTVIVSTKLTHRPRFHLLYRVSTIHHPKPGVETKGREGNVSFLSTAFLHPFRAFHSIPSRKPIPTRSTFSFCRLFSPFQPLSLRHASVSPRRNVLQPRSAPRCMPSFLRLFASGAMCSCIDYSLVITFACVLGFSELFFPLLFFLSSYFSFRSSG